MSTEPTPAELMRGLDRVEKAIREQRGEVNERLDKVPTAALMNSEFNALRGELSAVTHRLTKAESAVEALDARMDGEAAERTKNRRQVIMALVTSFLAPVVVALVLFVLLGG